MELKTDYAILLKSAENFKKNKIDEEIELD
jgi:hypothetical protein